MKEDDPDIFVDPIVLFDHEEPERRLYLAVIIQALLDASNKLNKMNKDKAIVRRNKINKDRAIAWFFCSIGVTCDNFEFVCDYAGLRPSSVREFAAYVINSEGEHEARDKLNRIWKGAKDEQTFE